MTPTRIRSLRRQYIGTLALSLAGVLALAIIAGRVGAGAAQPLAPLVWFTSLVTLLAFALALADRLLRQLVLRPLSRLAESGREVSQGFVEVSGNERLAPEFTAVLDGLAGAARVISEERQALAANIRSLDETNRLLTEARDAMIRTDRMASVGRLSAGIAHEIGNPLGAIVGYVGLLKRRLDGQELQLAEAAERECQRIDRIVRGLLDYARPREAMEQTVDLRDVVRDTLDLVGTQSRVAHAALISELSPEPVRVLGDPFQLQQVLVNLVVNAADAVDGFENPRISVRCATRPAAPPRDHVPSRRRDDPSGIDYSHRRRLAVSPRLPEGDPESESGMVAEIIVSDNGPGIPPELVDQIFEPFVTTKEPGKGTGLGLAVCTRLIEGMHGHVHAGTGPEGGAEFRIVLPALNQES